ncbi:hypothetical protein FNJ84_17740 [Paracoccus sp. M683]|uniref:hypothetical protein n=1 Tax=Paracoccus sp. M683 TaxID=2594268 RepID=UPI00117D8E44|nr:hypothetical protein [Paracoccus sp. M683]TRW94935.1 hypothetical protein FNJ84_17740 [Paracoccus sp. M683]
MDPSAIIQEIGGGLSAVVNVALAVALVALWRRNLTLTDRNDSLNDKMLEITQTMGRENRELIVATNTTLTAATGAINAAVNRLDRR